MTTDAKQTTAVVGGQTEPDILIVADEPVVTSPDTPAQTAKTRHQGCFYTGMVLGGMVGAIWALFNLPLTGMRLLREMTGPGQQADLLGEGDPVAQSLAAGREAARQRREELQRDEPRQLPY